MYYYAEGIITEDEQSFDLPTIFYKWADAADTYLVKRDLESLILQTQALLASRETQDNVISLLKVIKIKYPVIKLILRISLILGWIRCSMEIEYKIWVKLNYRTLIK